LDYIILSSGEIGRKGGNNVSMYFSIYHSYVRHMDHSTDSELPGLDAGFLGALAKKVLMEMMYRIVRSSTKSNIVMRVVLQRRPLGVNRSK